MSLLTGLLAFLTVIPASNREKKVSAPDIAAINDALDSVAIIADFTREVAALQTQLADMTAQRDAAIASNVVLRDRISAANGALANMQIERDDYRRLAHRMHDAYVLPLNPASFPNQAIYDPSRGAVAVVRDPATQETVFTYGDGAVRRISDFDGIRDPGHSHGISSPDPQMQAQIAQLEALRNADFTGVMLGSPQQGDSPPVSPMEHARQMWAACTCVPGRADVLTRAYRR
jgi:hypothetical protein